MAANVEINKKAIEEAVRILHRDGMVVYPTDTLYGLGADALSEQAVLGVYEAKQRIHGNPVSIAVADFEMIELVAVVDDISRAFCERFLPGPVTVILPARPVLPPMLTGGTGQIGIRMPDHPVAHALLEAFDSPITATSANTSGSPEPMALAEVNVPHEFSLEGGELSGTASTVVEPSTGQIFRVGDDMEAIGAFFAEYSS